MSNKYHISPTSGEAKPCSAQIKCQFGENTEHFDTKEEAQAAAGQKLAEQYGSTTTLKKKKKYKLDKYDVELLPQTEQILDHADSIEFDEEKNEITVKVDPNEYYGSENVDLESFEQQFEEGLQYGRSDEYVAKEINKEIEENDLYQCMDDIDSYWKDNLKHHLVHSNNIHREVARPADGSWKNFETYTSPSGKVSNIVDEPTVFDADDETYVNIEWSKPYKVIKAEDVSPILKRYRAEKED